MTDIILFVTEHELILIDKTPWFCRPYPLPLAHREEALKEFKKMLESGIIRRSSSVYINPIKIVVKKDGRIRPCLDAQKLNSLTK